MFNTNKGSLTKQTIPVTDWNPQGVDTSFTTVVSGISNVGQRAVTIDPSNNVIFTNNSDSNLTQTSSSLSKISSSNVVDTTFASNQGTGFKSFVPGWINTYGYINTICVQSDGKIVWGGEFDCYSDYKGVGIFRFNSDETEDTTFMNNVGTGASWSGINCIVQQSDGKLIVGGDFYGWNDNFDDFYLIRLNTDGTVDSTFRTNLGTGFDNSINSIAIQSDGKILVGGNFTSFNGNTRGCFTRLNSDGTEDTTFATNLGTGFNRPVNWEDAIAIQSDGKILVGLVWNGTSFNGTTIGRFTRLNSDGTLDTTFNTNLGTGFDSSVSSIAIQSDGKILVGGWFATFNGNARSYLVRLNTNGTEDTAFYTNFGGCDNGIDTVLVQPDNKIVLVGWFNVVSGGSVNNLARLNSNGTPDTTFNTNVGTDINDGAYVGKLLPSGDILIAGQFTYIGATQVRLSAKYSSSGVFDSTYTANMPGNFNGAADFIANGVLVPKAQSDGKIVVVGDFTEINGTSVTRITRLNANGTLDTAFNTNIGTGLDAQAFSVAIQSDGKILVGGDFTTFNGNSRNRLIRLNSDGTEDTSFYTNLGTGFTTANKPIRAIAVQSDGKILVGFTGYFGGGTFNGNYRLFLVRLNSDGTEDTTFYTNFSTVFDDYPTGSEGGVWDLDVQSDGKILIAGNLYSTTEFTRFIVRLNSDGTFDTTFNANIGVGLPGGSPRNRCNSVKVQSDGKILVGGPFAYNQSYSSRYGIIRLNSNGTEDVNFYLNINPGTGATNRPIQSIVINETNGYIYVAGDFPSMANTTVNDIALLYRDNSVPTTITVPAGVTQAIFQPCTSEGTAVGISTTVTVTPNTSYAVTINSSDYVLNNPNSVGTIFYWTNSSNISVTWVE